MHIKWIELQKNMPTVGFDVLISTENGGITTGYLSKKNENLWTLYNPELAGEKVIAWCPLPLAFKYSESLIYDNTCTETEKDVCDEAYKSCFERIKEITHLFLKDEEIKGQFTDCIFLAVKSYLDDNYKPSDVTELFQHCFESFMRNKQVEFKIK